MSEYVVVQVYTDGQWLDYSRCTASEAQSVLANPATSQRSFQPMVMRAKHWISGAELNASQLARMASNEVPGRFQEREPGAGDFWNVTLEFETGPGRTRTRITSVDGWTGPAWERLIADVSLYAAENGWEVASLRLG